MKWFALVYFKFKLGKTSCKLKQHLKAILARRKLNHTFHSYQTQNVHQNKMQQQATMNHCELQQGITSPSLASHPWQNLYLVQAQEVQGAPPPQAG